MSKNLQERLTNTYVLYYKTTLENHKGLCMRLFLENNTALYMDILYVCAVCSWSFFPNMFWKGKRCIGAWKGGAHWNVLPKIGKNCCRNLMLLSKALYFLATTFPEKIEKSFFLLTFLPRFSEFSQNFSTICVFHPNAQKKLILC